MPDSHSSSPVEEHTDQRDSTPSDDDVPDEPSTSEEQLSIEPEASPNPVEKAAGALFRTVVGSFLALLFGVFFIQLVGGGLLSLPEPVVEQYFEYWALIYAFVLVGFWIVRGGISSWIGMAAFPFLVSWLSIMLDLGGLGSDLIASAVIFSLVGFVVLSYMTGGVPRAAWVGMMVLPLLVLLVSGMLDLGSGFATDLGIYAAIVSLVGLGISNYTDVVSSTDG